SAARTAQLPSEVQELPSEGTPDASPQVALVSSDRRAQDLRWQTDILEVGTNDSGEEVPDSGPLGPRCDPSTHRIRSQASFTGDPESRATGPPARASAPGPSPPTVRPAAGPRRGRRGPQPPPGRRPRRLPWRRPTGSRGACERP